MLKYASTRSVIMSRPICLVLGKTNSGIPESSVTELDCWSVVDFLLRSLVIIPDSTCDLSVMVEFKLLMAQVNNRISNDGLEIEFSSRVADLMAVLESRLHRFAYWKPEAVSSEGRVA